MKNHKKRILVFSLFFLLFSSFTFSKTNLVRFAMIAPFGTPWSDEVYKAGEEINKRTQNAITLKIYDSAKMGDEPDYLRKMRSGQIHCGLFTGYGFSFVDPSILVMELPFIFESQEEGDWVYENMVSFYGKRFSKKGLELLGFSTYGKVYFITTKPIRSMKDFQTTKIWVWEGDPIIKNYFTRLQIPSRELPITEVLIGLQTGMVEGVYAPPLATIAFQWWTKTKYITTPHFRKGIGGALCTKEKWNSFQDDHKQVVREVMVKALNNVDAMVRKGNEEALQVLLKNNFQVVNLDEESVQDLKDLSKAFRKEMVGKIYDEAALSEVEKKIQAYHNQSKNLSKN